MTSGARRNFDAQDVTIACAAAVIAQLMFVAVFSLPPPKLIEADISNDNAQPIAVSITPVLKLGTKNPTKLPSQWQRKQPVAAKSQPQAPLPSTKAEKTASATPTATASVAAPVVDAGKAEPPSPTAPESSANALATASSVEGSEQGAANGTETDPLKARAADMYKAQLASWVMSRFNIRGKLPFDKLKTLRAVAQVTVEDRKITSFSVVKPSGDSTFDGEVEATLQKIQSSGAELPAPPPMYPEMLARSQTFSFQCTLQKLCE
jgi:hypothetical protein